MTRPKSFLEQPDEEQGTVQCHFRVPPEEREQLQIWCIKRHRPMSAWLRDAMHEKLARELEEYMRHPSAPAEEEPPDIGSLLQCHT